MPCEVFSELQVVKLQPVISALLKIIDKDLHSAFLLSCYKPQLCPVMP